ncbi:MAG: CHAP domain-containing protein [Actinocatenispora sp.]
MPSSTPRRGAHRVVLRVLGAAAVAAGLALAPATAASASISAYVWHTDGDGVNVHSAASTSSGVVTALAEGATVTVDCQTTGTSVNGTTIWDHLPAYGGYATDSYIYTGYDGWSPDLPRCGSNPPGGDVGDDIVATAQTQVGNGPDKYTNAGGVSSDTPWCSLFVSWTWRQNGITTPYYVYSGDLFYWSQDRGLAHYGTSGMRPGDAVFFGTGPQAPSGSDVPSVHVGIVKSVNGDGTINTIEGNYANRVAAPGAFDPDGYRSDVGRVYGYAHPA